MSRKSIPATPPAAPRRPGQRGRPAPERDTTSDAGVIGDGVRWGAYPAATHVRQNLTPPVYYVHAASRDDIHL